MQVIFIHSSDTDGRAFVGRFQTTSQNQGEDIEKKVQVKYCNTNIKINTKVILTTKISRNIIFFFFF